MKININHLKIFLFLVALHSFFVGLGLLFLPTHLFVEFGYNPIAENFFRAQGGIFHIVMVVAYLMAMKEPVENKVMVQFSISAKFIAVLFLFGYYIFIENILVVFLSGVGDLIMALILLFLSKKLTLSNAG